MHALTLKPRHTSYSKPRHTGYSASMKALFFRQLYAYQIISLDQLGKLAELLGNIAYLDDIAVRMDNQFLETHVKGKIILGQYEYPERRLIQKYLPRDEQVIELGASIGVVSCVVNRRLAFPGQHIVVEANPDLISELKKNRELNRCQFHIIDAAIGYGSNYLTFCSNKGSLAGSIYRRDGGRLMTVPSRTLQSIAKDAGFGRFHLICDIEGSEVDLIDHELPFLSEHVDLLFLETHYGPLYNQEKMSTIIEKLQRGAFEIIDKIDTNYCLRNRGLFRQQEVSARSLLAECVS